MKNNLQKCHIMKSVSKYIKEKSKNSPKKIDNTLIVNHTKKVYNINLKKALKKQEAQNSKYKTSKNSRKYINNNV